jgi:hypothetical protein
VFTAPSRRPSHTGRSVGAPCWWVLGLGVFAAMTATDAHAQYIAGGGNGFRYSSPEFSITLRGGLDSPLARSDVFAFTTETLTLSRGDFAALGLTFDFALRAARRVEAVFSGGFASRERASEFRKFIDNNNQPIERADVAGDTNLQHRMGAGAADALGGTRRRRHGLHVSAGRRLRRFPYARGLPGQLCDGWMGANGVRQPRCRLGDLSAQRDCRRSPLHPLARQASRRV